ncbi:Hypothetical predicted protein, partial [Paramuricea clavata]
MPKQAPLSSPMLRVRLQAVIDRSEGYLTALSSDSNKPTLSSTAKATANRISKNSDLLTSSLNSYMESLPESETIPEDAIEISKKCSDLLVRSDIMADKFEALLIGVSPPPSPKLSQKSRLPKVELRQFDESQPVTWFHQLEIQLK